MERNLNHEQVSYTNSLPCRSCEAGVASLLSFHFSLFSLIFQVRISVLSVWTFFFHDSVIRLPCHMLSPVHVIGFPKTAMNPLFMIYAIARANYIHDHVIHVLPPSHGGTMAMIYEALVS